VIVFTPDEVRMLVIMAALCSPDPESAHEVKALHHKASCVVRLTTDEAGNRVADTAPFQVQPEHG
jgi:hypothetical protein